MTELTTIVAAERVIDIKHPATEAPIGLRITLLPDTDERVRAVARKAVNERLAGKGKLTAEKSEQGRLDILTASMGGWEWAAGLSFHGEQPQLTQQIARQLLTELPWIADQIDTVLGDRAGFFPSVHAVAA
ncbi:MULTISPECIES: hypothetical protein [Xanthomonas]|uniref:Uncharacterized protein n=2 Tax=Xanthomonas TaxID=338 RepID=A0A7Z7IVU1_XANCH|nr:MULTISPECIES: hypothetical protein [Xanthomonas]ATS40461.1 hypothetical protein XcfCFBP6988P_21940 [Xanthomonas citri pv. phaseoli var. fuscans]ATS44623.1 hypothetical protein XcfCFBP6989P_21335 [Xanthomonas citri pv. phaseoli var. fuscans]ATS48469.1 hypothetical protein XcfCFBP6990P_18810 [Xanthomonas citri pv. phaseoli var. fuscans]ATS85153.1 hypothetical protein XcfCFBP6991P_15430 [Xanthomonas citri pv. phaseoli var. fuscans]QWN22081.1 hypothetical protein DGM98_19885 [Xanthomonas citri]